MRSQRTVGRAPLVVRWYMLDLSRPHSPVGPWGPTTRPALDANMILFPDRVSTFSGAVEPKGNVALTLDRLARKVSELPLIVHRKRLRRLSPPLMY